LLSIKFNKFFIGAIYSLSTLLPQSSSAESQYNGDLAYGRNAPGRIVVAARPFLSPAQYALLEELFDTHLNYFLSNDAVTISGLPLGAYKEGDRGRYNYSNPAEWGYTLIAWIMAAERGVITKEQAASKLETALDTMLVLQNNPGQNYQKLFYPYYYVADRDGNDRAFPYHDTNHWIPSIDNGFLYTSLLIVEGWAKASSLTTIENKTHSIRGEMNFRMFLEPDGKYLAHAINADTAALSSSHWNIYADEGGVMAWIAYLSNSITFSEYKILVDQMIRPCRIWNGIVVSEAAWFNAMFTWGVRSWAGFPVATWETGLQNHYSLESFANTVKAHLAYGEQLGIYYPAFSDAMTQVGGIGRYTPPNIPNQVPEDAPEHIVPHALFVPFCIGPDLAPDVLTALMAKISHLKDDAAGYYHDGADGHKPFGFEVTASPYKDDVSYRPVESRYIYETLSHAYTTMSIFQGLSIHDGRPTLLYYACQIPGYFQKIEEVLHYLYPVSNNILRVPQDYPTIQQAIHSAVRSDTILVASGVYNEHLILKSGLRLKGSGAGLLTPEDLGDDTVIDGASTGRPIYCDGIANVLIEGFTIINGRGNSAGGNIYCVDSSVTIRDNLIMNGRTTGAGGYGGGLYSLRCQVQIAGNLIKNNQAWHSGGGIKLCHSSGYVLNNIISGNTSDWGGGIDCLNSSPQINNNVIEGNFADYQDGGGFYGIQSSPAIINNIFIHNKAGQWGNGQGGAIYLTGQSPVIINNIVVNNTADRSTGGIYCASPSSLLAYNDVYGNAGGDYFGCSPGPGSISADPMFVNPAGGDYRLQLGSSCIDAGDPDPNYHDLDGTRNDLGIYGGPDAHQWFFRLADLNNDGKIDFQDYSIFAANWLIQGQALDGNINADAMVDINDLKLLKLCWPDSHL